MRYCVNATVTSEAWTHIEADTDEDADEKASNLRAGEFELGDAFEHEIVSVDSDE